jgi:hypothetical protein
MAIQEISREQSTRNMQKANDEVKISEFLDIGTA